MRFLENQRFWQLLLGTMLVSLAFIAFWPTPVDQPLSVQLADVLKFLHGHGVPGWFNYKFVEATANIVLFVPLGFVSTLAFREKHYWHIAAFGLIVSGCIELGQLLFLHHRYASPSDIVMNTSGAVIGAVLATLVTKKGRPAAFRQQAPQKGSSRFVGKRVPE